MLHIQTLHVTKTSAAPCTLLRGPLKGRELRMTQGRKSRTVLAIVCALAALAAGALLAPAVAGAQADQEYNLELPGAGGGNGQTPS